MRQQDVYDLDPLSLEDWRILYHSLVVIFASRVRRLGVRVEQWSDAKLSKHAPIINTEHQVRTFRWNLSNLK